MSVSKPIILTLSVMQNCMKCSQCGKWHCLFVKETRKIECVCGQIYFLSWKTRKN